MVEDEKTPEVEVDPKADPVVPEGEKEISAEDGVEALKQQLKRSNEALEHERNQNRELSAKSSRAENEVQDANLEMIKSAIQTVNQDSKLLKAQYADALRDGRFEDAANIQEGISLNASKFLQLENGRVSLEEQKKNPPKPATPALPTDPVERLAAQLSPKSAAWVRAHPDYAIDQKKYTRMIGAHNNAIAEGLVADTTDYFNYIEEELKINRKPVTRDVEQDDDPVSTAGDAKGGRNAPPAAPTTGAGSSQLNGKGNSMRLTQEERDIAKMNGLTDEEYAKNKIALKREGRLN